MSKESKRRRVDGKYLNRVRGSIFTDVFTPGTETQKKKTQKKGRNNPKKTKIKKKINKIK